MARSRKKAPGGDVGAGEPSLAPAVAVGVLSALAVGEAVLADGTRTVPGQWYELDRAQLAYWDGRGIFWTQAQIDALWAAEGRILSPIEGRTAAAPIAPGTLRVLQLTHYDPGCAVYRYHSAANSVPGVVSAFARIGHSNPACDLRQWDVDRDRDRVAMLLRTADVVHCHMDYTVLLNELGGLPSGVRAAITYHGSTEPNRPPVTDPAADTRMRSIVFGARPYHRRFDAHWLPIPMPVADYAALAKGRTRGDVLRVSHRPTRRAIKGTDVLMEVMAGLQAEGVAIELVLLEGLSHGEALRRKATCHVTFDSFWLGMQGSGLEAAAMGQAVVAGTWDADYERVGLNAPWTVADDAETLRTVLRRMATDAAYLEREAKRVNAYVRAHHDYPVVGARYRDLLREGMS